MLGRKKINIQAQYKHSFGSELSAYGTYTAITTYGNMCI